MSDDLVKRHMNGEIYAGLEVMAYMEDCDTPMGVVPRFSSHWSTPGAGAKNLQRLFSQSQVDGLLSRIEALEAALEKADALADEMERLMKRTPFLPAPNGITVKIELDQIADQRAALTAYREARK